MAQRFWSRDGRQIRSDKTVFFSPAPAVENTPSEARVNGHGSEGENSHTSPAAPPARGLVVAVPVPAGPEEANASQIEPEDSAGELAQRVGEPESSVAERPSAAERQNGVLSPPLALQDSPSEAAVEERGSEGEPSVAARPLAKWITLVPLSACRRADSFLTEDEEAAKKASGLAVDSGGARSTGGRLGLERSLQPDSRGPEVWDRVRQDPGCLAR